MLTDEQIPQVVRQIRSTVRDVYGPRVTTCVHVFIDGSGRQGPHHNGGSRMDIPGCAHFHNVSAFTALRHLIAADISVGSPQSSFFYAAIPYRKGPTVVYMPTSGMLGIVPLQVNVVRPRKKNLPRLRAGNCTEMLFTDLLKPFVQCYRDQSSLNPTPRPSPQPTGRGCSHLLPLIGICAFTPLRLASVLVLLLVLWPGWRWFRLRKVRQEVGCS